MMLPADYDSKSIVNRLRHIILAISSCFLSAQYMTIAFVQCMHQHLWHVDACKAFGGLQTSKMAAEWVNWIRAPSIDAAYCIARLIGP